MTTPALERPAELVKPAGPFLLNADPAPELEQLADQAVRRRSAMSSPQAAAVCSSTTSEGKTVQGARNVFVIGDHKPHFTTLSLRLASLEAVQSSLPDG